MRSDASKQLSNLTPYAISGVDLILGINGMVWLTSAGYLDAGASDAEPLARSDYEAIARAANAIRALVKVNFTITPAKVSAIVKVQLTSSFTNKNPLS